MINQKELDNEIDSLIERFLKAGCSLETTRNFICNNYDYIEKNKDAIVDNLYFIFNHDSLYGILMMFDDKYEWAVYEDNNFYPIQSSITLDKKDSDYIVEMMISFAKAEKIKAIVPEVENMDLKNKVKVLKRVGLNSEGYHFE